MTPDRPDCPACGQEMDLGDWVEEPKAGGPATYFYTCRNDDCPETKHWVNDRPGPDDPSDENDGGEGSGDGPDDPGAAAAAAAVTTDQRSRDAVGFFQLPDNCSDLFDLFLTPPVRQARAEALQNIEQQAVPEAVLAVGKTMVTIQSIRAQVKIDRKQKRQLQRNQHSENM